MSEYKDLIYQQNRKSILAGEPDCAICGKAKANTVDHIIPMDAGGDHNLDNLRPACGSCNYRLGAIYRNRKTAQRIQNRNNAMNAVEVRPCETCGTMFTPDWRNQARGGGKYCSVKCVHPLKPKWTYIAKWDCRICGKAMATDIMTTDEEPNPSVRHTCGQDKCQTEYNNIVNREAYRFKTRPDYQSELAPSTWSVHATYHEPNEPRFPEFG